ncbi:hypothetical protein [Actinosynnema sp. NPDC020468]|uniref:hypothetical protein n=1 Tax=Actinosynnema sp. NPDC020468 TaxID=3154488 RepID=UPI0033F71DA8
MRWFLLVVLLAGCGSTPPPPPVLRADEATTASATRATITAGDLGPSWTADLPPRESEPVAADDCAAGTLYATLPPGARQTGTRFRYGGTSWYASSAAAVFPDEPGARGWVEIRKSSEYVECRRAELERSQRAADDHLSVATRETTTGGLGVGGYQAYSLYQVRSAGQDANGTFARHVYRVGRTVVSVSVDITAAPSDPPNLGATVSSDLGHALAAVYARTTY